jgi:hypothetical protein
MRLQAGDKGGHQHEFRDMGTPYTVSHSTSSQSSIASAMPGFNSMAITSVAPPSHFPVVPGGHISTFPAVYPAPGLGASHALHPQATYSPINSVPSSFPSSQLVPSSKSPSELGFHNVPALASWVGGSYPPLSLDSSDMDVPEPDVKHAMKPYLRAAEDYVRQGMLTEHMYLERVPGNLGLVGRAWYLAQDDVQQDIKLPLTAEIHHWVSFTLCV